MKKNVSLPSTTGNGGTSVSPEVTGLNFKTISENLPLALVLVGSDGRVTYWNTAAQFLLGGTTPEHAIGRSAAELLPLLPKVLDSLVARVRAGERDVSMVIHYEDAGVAGQYEMRLFQVGDITGIVVDPIPEREPIDPEANDFGDLPDLYYYVPLSLLTIFHDGSIKRANKAFLEWLGYDSFSELSGTDISEILTPASREIVRAKYETENPESKAGTLNIDFLRKDGSLTHAHVGVLPVFDPESYRWFFRWRVSDPATIKPAELRTDDAALFNELFNELGEGVLIADATGHIIRANQAAVGIFGTTMEQLTSMNLDSEFWRAVHENGSPMLIHEQPALTALKEKRAITNLEMGVIREDGSLVWILISVAPLLDSAGNAVGVIATFPDITATVQQRLAMRELSDSLAVERDRANEANRLKSSFLANLSHEIRTPMTAILGFTDILLLDLSGKVSDAHYNFLRSINTSGKRLLNLINDILDLSKIEAGRLDLQMDTLDILAEIEMIASPLQFIAQQKSVQLIIEVPQERYHIYGDRQRLAQVLTNIIGNAVKFTREGSVTVSIASSGENEVVVSVRDTGIGINPEFIPHLFEEFRQQHTGLTREFGGTGLGLAISQRLVSLMRGRIEVESAEGVGTTFRLVFQRPSSDDHQRQERHVVAQTVQATIAASSSSVPVQAKPGANGKAALRRVLVVEDNLEMQRLMDAYLKGQYLTSFAKNADEAIEAFQHEKPDAILMDINLPGRDGLAITREIRGGNINRAIPIIAVTAFAMVGDRDRILASGCTAYLSKPATKREVLEALDKVLVPKG